MIKRNRNKTKNFTIISNEIFQDTTISAKAKGLYAYLMSLPDDWKVHKAQLHNAFKDSVDGIRTAFDELVEAGYIVSDRTHDQKGRACWSHTVYESPVAGKSNIGKSNLGKSYLGKSNTTKDYPKLKTKEETKETPKAPSGTPAGGGADEKKELAIIQFENLYASHKRKGAKAPALKYYLKLSEVRKKRLAEYVSKNQGCKGWTKDNGQFRPLLRTIIRDEDWLDDEENWPISLETKPSEENLSQEEIDRNRGYRVKDDGSWEFISR